MWAGVVSRPLCVRTPAAHSWLLQALKEEGVEIDPHREDYDYGRFAWIMDPDGNWMELWEPPKDDSQK